MLRPRRVFNCEPQTTQTFGVSWREGKQLILVKEIFKQQKFTCHIGSMGLVYLADMIWLIFVIGKLVGKSAGMAGVSSEVGLGDGLLVCPVLLLR